MIGNTLYHCCFPSDVDDGGNGAARREPQGEARARRGGARGRALRAIPDPRISGTSEGGIRDTLVKCRLGFITEIVTSVFYVSKVTNSESVILKLLLKPRLFCHQGSKMALSLVR